jgi:hypothetical protein
VFVWYYSPILGTRYMKDRWENLYAEVHLKRNSLAKFYYPIFLTRRAIFFMIPVLFTGKVVF